jgi:hypothetical protein
MTRRFRLISQKLFILPNAFRTGHSSLFPCFIALFPAFCFGVVHIFLLLL